MTETEHEPPERSVAYRLIAAPSQDELGLPDPDMAATGDGRMITAAINALTEQVAMLIEVIAVRSGSHS